GRRVWVATVSGAGVDFARTVRSVGVSLARTPRPTQSRVGMVPIAFRGHIDGAGRARRASDHSVVRTPCPQRQRRSDRLGDAAQASSLILPGLWRGAFDVPGREMYLRANP